MKRVPMTRWFYGGFRLRRRGSLDWMIPASIGLGFGVVAGLGAGMLFAPYSGEETRERLARGARHARERARLTAAKAREELMSAAQHLKSDANQVRGEVNQLASQAMVGEGGPGR
jgi:gas vesicle protein